MKRRSVGSVCYKKFFYGAETGKKDEVSQRIEEFLKTQIEDPISKKLPKLIKKIENNEQITDEDKYWFSLLLSTMWMRNPYFRRQINSMEEQVLKHVTSVLFSQPEHEKKLEEIAEGAGLPVEKYEEAKSKLLNGEYEVDFSNQTHLKFMMDGERLREFTNLFFGQNWLVHISRCNRQFVASDNPITVIIPQREGPYPPTFLERTHIFPLTPTIAIEALYPENNIGKKLKRKTHFNGSEGVIDWINLQIASKAGFIYSQRHNEIEWFDEYGKKLKAAAVAS